MPSRESDNIAYLRQIYDAAISAVLPAETLAQYLPEPPKGHCVVVGAGKASAAMAAVVDAEWPDVNLSGVITTRYDHAVDAGRIRVIEAGHPVPDENSAEGARQVLRAVQGLTAEDLVIALISGGGSATLALPVEGVSLADKQEITRSLLASGAAIEDINIVRQQLSQIKGGGLAASVGDAQLLSLLISDIPGDNAAAIASGPTFASLADGAAALAILEGYKISISEPLRQYLATRRATGAGSSQHKHHIIARPADALRAAANEAEKLGFQPIILGDSIEGESAELGKTMAGIAESVLCSRLPVSAPAAIISGGETTVSIGSQGAGRGGRNTEFALSLALALNARERVYALACDSDGIDGTEDAAGAIITPKTLQRAAALDLDARSSLDRHDSYSFFDALDSLVRSGPTLTNVNDIRVVLVTT